MSYSDLLKDPRWQRKRLEVMEREDFACELCGATDKTLNVHHERYERGRMPWDYPSEALHCLCEPCHRKEHGIEDAAEKAERERARIRKERGEQVLAAWKVEHPEAAAVMDRLDTLRIEMRAATTDAEHDRTARAYVDAMCELREMGGGPQAWTRFR